MAVRSGVTVLNRDACDDSYTLYSSRQTEVAHLIDRDGNEVHQWSYVQGQTWHYAEMLPNGNLVAISKEDEGHFAGQILELDWDRNLVWKADVAAHHDFDRLSNGNTLAVCREYVEDEELRPGSIKSDVILELTPDCETVWEWHAHEHVRQIAELVTVRFPLEYRDWGHMNTVESLPDGPAAQKDPRFAAGNVLFSCRNIDTIGVIEKHTGAVVWAWGPGVIDKQHMPTMLPTGRILVYDNGCEAKRTRILEIEPITGEIVWEYQADPPESFYSPTRGSNQRLPNGNTFIADSDNGRLLEVTESGETVWEFFNPDRLENGNRMPLYRSIRYPSDQIRELLKAEGRRPETRDRRLVARCQWSGFRFRSRGTTVPVASLTL